MEWISVKDSMPKTEFIKYLGNRSAHVLIKVINDNEVRMGWWNLDKRKWQDASDLACCGCPSTQYEFEQVTHWMKLPELPEQIKREDNEKHCKNCLCKCDCRVFDIEHRDDCPCFR